MVVNGERHVSEREELYRLFEFLLIVVRVHPQFLDVPRRVASKFEAHERDVLDEGEVAVNILRELCKARDCESMEDDPYFGADAVARRLMEPHHRLVERAPRLHYVVVDACHVGVKGNAKTDIRVAHGSEAARELPPCERPSVREHMEFRIGHPLFEPRNDG